MLNLTAWTDYYKVSDVAISSDGRTLIATGNELVKIWDSRRPSDEMSVERDAVSLLHFMQRHRKTRADVIKSIQTDRTIRESVRKRALQLAPALKQRLNEFPDDG
ncbi:MAG: hypothetical protein O3A00_00065 [Planctomycetota bacterium]|nr:hypothetical protein [Planctomycetota bacterium]